MKGLIFTACIISIASACNPQTDLEKVKFNPPVIVKDAEILKAKGKEAVKFTPPVIKKDEEPKAKKTKRKEVVKFTPPVITKDSAKNN